MSHFNRQAATWDSPQKIEMMKILSLASIQALQRRGLLDSKLDIVDFGCGTGLFGLAFIDFARTLTGIDTSTGMLEVFEQKIQGHPHMKTILANLEVEDVDISADLIVSALAFHHLEDPVAVILKLKKMISSNGVIVIVDLDEEDGSFHPNNEEMGVRYFGFNKQVVEQWAIKSGMLLDYSIVHNLKRGEHTYPIFMAILGN